MHVVVTALQQSSEEDTEYPFSMQHKEFMNWISTSIVCKLMETLAFEVLQVVRQGRSFVAIVSTGTGEALIGHGTRLDFSAAR